MSTTLYFSVANDLSNQIWSYADGVAQEVQEVNDDGIANYSLFTVNGDLYFDGYTSATGTELWAANASAAGAHLVNDLNPGEYSSDPSGFLNYGGEFLFSASGADAVGLYSVNAGSGGVVEVQANWPGSFTSQYEFGDLIYFVGLGDLNYVLGGLDVVGEILWVSNGTPAGTHVVDNNPPGLNPLYMTYFNGDVYFSADDDTLGYQLYRTDGTAAGTSRVEGINPAGDSYPDYLCVVGDDMFFSATGGSNVYELWKTTANGVTSMVKAIAGDAQFLSPSNLVDFDDELYFTADDGEHGSELWKSDGTPSGTQMISPTFSASDASGPSNMTVVGATLYFTADDGVHGEELWKYSADDPAPTMVDDINPGSGGSHPTDLTEVNGELYFEATADGTAYNLYTTGGASNGITALASNVTTESGLAATWTSVKNDFSDSGSSGILFENGSQAADWRIADGQQAAETYLGNYGGGEVLVGTGDFYGAGTTDVLFETPSTGEIVSWSVTTGASTGSNTIGEAGAGWDVVGTGDFNGDGTQDILFQNSSTGEVVDWLMQDGAMSQAIYMGNAAGYNVVGTGDFYGEGTSDILFEDSSNNIIEWTVAGGHVASGAYVGTLGPQAGWKLVATGDLQGTGISDLVFQNTNTGAVVDWRMANGAIASTNYLGSAVGYNVVDTGYYHGVGAGGSGTADILFQGANGGIVDWQMQSGYAIGEQIIGSVGAGWQAS